MVLSGSVKKDTKTKNLVKRLEYGDIALIKHKDIDEIAALSLVEKKPKAILNVKESISGKYPNKGPEILLNSGIKLIDLNNESLFDDIEEGSKIEIINNEIYKDNSFYCKGKIINEKIITQKIRESNNNLEKELDNFIENTLKYAKKEKDLILGKISIPDISLNFEKKHVLVVVRGRDYKKDLAALKPYITEMKPILIGVDGGGDALLEFGYKPDIVIGDMDSVSDRCLLNCKEIIVHAYSNGYAPGMKRIEKLGLKCKLFSVSGTSEDIALLLAYEKGADFIVAVGTHTNMIDFLEKGRKGMASTFLVRLKVGSKLVDAKGVNKLYKERIKPIYILSVFLASLMPIGIISIFSPLSQNFFKLVLLRIKIILGMKGLLW